MDQPFRERVFTFGPTLRLSGMNKRPIKSGEKKGNKQMEKNFDEAEELIKSPETDENQKRIEELFDDIQADITDMISLINNK